MLDAPTVIPQERRNYTRLDVRKNTMAFNATTFGEIINISEGGLRIKCLLHSDDNFETSFTVGLLSNTGNYFLDHLPCKVVSIKDSSPLRSSRSTFIREAGLMFLDLTADQKAKLALFLQQNTIPQS